MADKGSIYIEILPVGHALEIAAIDSETGREVRFVAPKTATEDEIKQWLINFFRRFFGQQFKRSAMPNGPKIGSVALSPRGDWRMPSDASVQI